MKVVLFGAAGQVGKDCLSALEKLGYEVVPLTRAEVDFSKPEIVTDRILSIDADFIVNACAYTAVDKAEIEKEIAELVNYLSVEALAKACKQKDIPLIHLSTDYVFDGNAESPYSELSTVNALGVYGQTKLSGEQAIQASMANFVILRTSWVFGEQGNNFVKTMLRLGKEREELKVVNDQYGRPTYVGDIVSTILFFLKIYDKKGTLPWGVYHCSSTGHTNWYEFACAIFSNAVELGILDKAPRIVPIPSEEFPTPAPRPAYSVLSTEKLEKFMGESLPHWQEGLTRFLKQYFCK
jgi:dTDP-4-dehydrorhamnose reductase